MFDAVVVEVEFGEEGLVEFTPDVPVGLGVEPFAVLEQGERGLEALFEQMGVEAGDVEEPLGFVLFLVERSLASFEVGEGDGAFEVGVEEFLASACDSLQPAGLGGDKLLVVSALLGQFVFDRFPCLRDDLRGDAQFLPVSEDSLLHRVDGEIGEVAAGAFLVATEAEEIGVEPAAPAAGLPVAEP